MTLARDAHLSVKSLTHSFTDIIIAFCQHLDHQPVLYYEYLQKFLFSTAVGQITNQLGGQGVLTPPTYAAWK